MDIQTKLVKEQERLLNVARSEITTLTKDLEIEKAERIISDNRLRLARTEIQRLEDELYGITKEKSNG